MIRIGVPSRRAVLAVFGIGAGVAAQAATGQTSSALRTQGAAPGLYRDRSPGAVAHNLETILDHPDFISAYRFFTADQIADAREYRGRLDLTAALQTALDAAWSSNRDLFLPAGLYRVAGLVLPGGQAERSRSFRFYGQGTGELFARAENGGTIVKGIADAPVLVSRQDRAHAGNGNQEIAYIRFEGNSGRPVLDFATLFAQSELHHCGIFQAGTGDGVRIRQANTIELHHNYVLNRDWAAERGTRRTGAGFRVSSTNDNGLLTMRKNSVRGFDWGIRLGGEGGGRLYSARVEQCEASTCSNGMLLDEGMHGAVIDNCFFEGGDGGVGIHNAGRGNTLSSNYMFPGFSVGIEDTPTARATRIVGNTLSAGNARTIAPSGCTLVRVSGDESPKTIEGNTLICDPVSAGPIARVIGLDLLGQEPALEIRGNTFDPVRRWGAAPEAAHIRDRTGGRGPRGSVPFADGTVTHFARGALSLKRVTLDDAAFAGKTLLLPAGSWFEIGSGSPLTVEAIDGGAHDGRLVVLWDRTGRLAVEASPLIRLDGGRTFRGPGSLTLLLQAEGGATEALELARSSY